MRRITPIGAVLVCTALIVAACSQGAATTEPTTTTLTPLTTLVTTTTSPTTTVPAPTTTATPAPNIADTVNGLEADESSVQRRAVVIKIDNHSNARPQSGLMDADLVYEILVEGGLTRFAAVFHQSDLDYVGPVRSGRPTDVGVVKPLDAPFQISGAQPWVQDIFKAEGLKMVYDNGTTTWREHHRSAPHNLYSSTYLIRDYADGRGWSDESPGNVFSFGDPTPTSGTATNIELDWSDHPDVRWVWNGETYERFNGSVPHKWVTEDGEDGIVTTPMIVVLVGRRYTASPSGKGSSVPATDTVGSGTAIVFRDGGVIEGTWQRDRNDVPFELSDASGNDIVLPASKMWIAIFPDNRTVNWS
ncbi:MAG: DUF3048 domain-containing protein [Armatimonadetes bacterium]|nr:MAG: DUF3048 domain-containing protein [Armatimonadota bacterium]